MVFILSEIIDIFISSIVITYLFKSFIPDNVSDEIKWKVSAIVSIPSLVLHEFAHKFMAIIFGANAIYQANYFGLIIGIVLKIANLPLFFVPAFVSFQGTNITNLQLALIALAGPILNLILFLVADLLQRYEIWQKHGLIIHLTKEVNKWLLILNLLPLPFLRTDGFQALRFLIGL